MIEYRPFLNTDPPLLVDVWRRQKPFRSMVESLTTPMLDSMVFAKPYFDRDGLILALDGERAVGFVHAGFGPNADLSDIDRHQPVISQLKVVPGDGAIEIAQELLAKAFDYLKRYGGTECTAFNRFPYAPYYMGLYGGSRIPGIPTNDEITITAMKQFGFKPIEEIKIFARSLTGFRTPVGRQQRTIRREYRIVPAPESDYGTWWENCSLGICERQKYNLQRTSDDADCGFVTYWDMQPLAAEWGVRARGIFDMAISPELRRSGLGTFLVGQSLVSLLSQGVSLVEAQTTVGDEASSGVFQKLGFDETGTGYLYHRQID